MTPKLTALALLPLATLALAAGPAHAADEADANAVPPPFEGPLPAGTYTLDPAHASLVFRVNHIGMSNYTASFAEFDAELELDPADPATAQVTATIDPASLSLGNPPEGFKATLLGADWFDVASFPAITFTSTEVEVTGAESARITGDLALLGVTRPVVLEATFNGGYPGHPMDPGGSRIGFSAQGKLQRSDFGLDIGIPAPGSTLGVSDAVEFVIEAEFTRPLDGEAVQ